MLKRYIQRWLGIDAVLNELSGAFEVLTHMADNYDRLSNMYDSNRIRIDAITAIVNPPKTSAKKAKRQVKTISTTGNQGAK